MKRPVRSASASAPRTESFKKRSVTVEPDLDRWVVERVGPRGYSRLVNEGLLLLRQADGIAQSVEEFEAECGPLTAGDVAAAQERISRALAAARRA